MVWSTTSWNVSSDTIPLQEYTRHPREIYFVCVRVLKHRQSCLSTIFTRKIITVIIRFSIIRNCLYWHSVKWEEPQIKIPFLFYRWNPRGIFHSTIWMTNSWFLFGLCYHQLLLVSLPSTQRIDFCYINIILRIC